MTNRLLTKAQVADLEAKHWHEESDGHGAVDEVFDAGGFAEEIAQLVRQSTRKEVMEWADLPCPHGTQTADTSWASRRECEECWQDLREKWGIE